MKNLETLNEVLDNGLTIVLVLFIGFMSGCVMIGGPIAVDLGDIKEQAVERGHAHYNPTNGVWQWKEAK